MTRVDVADLATQGMLTEALGVSQACVSKWMAMSDFPPPVVVLGRRPVYLVSAVKRWVKKHKQQPLAQDTHGTRDSYGAGCRCPDCTDAHRVYMRAYMRARRERLAAEGGAA